MSKGKNVERQNVERKKRRKKYRRSKKSKGKMSKGKNVENDKMPLLTSINVCSYYFSRIFFRLLLKSFRRLADTFLPIDLYERMF
jgi:hypothetical protein